MNDRDVGESGALSAQYHIGCPVEASKVNIDPLEGVRLELQNRADPRRAESAKWFFKTGPGEYGEGDVFIGVPVPAIRALASRYRDLDRDGILCLLRSVVHEERALALMILIHQFKKGSQRIRQEIFNLYLGNTASINNWDLVDLSAKWIVGGHLRDKPKAVLYTLARSSSLWERRIAVLATFGCINEGDSEDALRIAEILLPDRHDLIQKAVGWMLREVGKRCSEEVEEGFLKEHYRSMGRTALRYAIERFAEGKRRAYLRGEIE
jgi:3-methyladenine DNA glycosylase AlkD